MSRADLQMERGYPATINHAAQTTFAAEVAGEVAGPDQVDLDCEKVGGAEDFSYMLEERPGAYLFLGAGAGGRAAPPGI